MMAQIIDGKALALEKEAELKEKISKLENPPKVISILIGEDPASVLYTNMKQEKASELGIDFHPLKYPENTGFEEIKNKILELNEDPKILGIMIQLPLPKSFLGINHPNELLELINPKKDIDGLNPRDSNFIPATARGVISILNVIPEIRRMPESRESRTRSMDPGSMSGMTGLVIAVVGSEGEVGQSLVYELTNREATILKVDKKLPDTSLEDLKNAGIVISATGVKDLVKAEDIKDGAILIDVGLGDFSESALKKSSFYTPKVGGTGPMTVISLMENIVEAASLSS